MRTRPGGREVRPPLGGKVFSGELVGDPTEDLDLLRDADVAAADDADDGRRCVVSETNHDDMRCACLEYVLGCTLHAVG